VLQADERRLLSVRATNVSVVVDDEGARTEVASAFPPPPRPADEDEMDSARDSAPSGAAPV